ncbi:MAG TPA: hypothetical protein VFS49_05165 [Croceibacterium sp.]|nr:hypothetical protein [Croceibacterium sp.]
MATQDDAGTIGAAPQAVPRVHPWAPQAFDKLLALAALALLAAVLAALARGFGQWERVPAVVWAHIATILVALVLTPLMLLRKRGDRPHRVLGWTWASALFLTALISFWVRTINPGGFSLIHLLSVLTIVQVPLIVLYARRHDWKRHRTAVRGMVTGALLVAGFFTFPFGRLLGAWLFG